MHGFHIVGLGENPPGPWRAPKMKSQAPGMFKNVRDVKVSDTDVFLSRFNKIMQERLTATPPLCLSFDQPH